VMPHPVKHVGHHVSFIDFTALSPSVTCPMSGIAQFRHYLDSSGRCNRTFVPRGANWNHEQMPIVGLWNPQYYLDQRIKVMKRTALLITTYYLGGAVAATVGAAVMHLGILFVVFVLAVLYLGHLWWTMLWAKHPMGPRACLLCQQQMNSRRADRPFCCAEHQSRWLCELDEIAVRRLQAARDGACEPMEVPKRVVREEMGSENDDLALVLVDVQAC